MQESRGRRKARPIKQIEYKIRRENELNLRR